MKGRDGEELPPCCPLWGGGEELAPAWGGSMRSYPRPLGMVVILVVSAVVVVVVVIIVVVVVVVVVVVGVVGGVSIVMNSPSLHP
jgi:hypothetical protein